MGIVLSAAGLQQGFQWMNGAEWVDTVVQMRAYWLVRTLAGISMDIGMSLLMINLMMTALKRSAAAIGFRLARSGARRDGSACGRGACKMNARFVALVAGVGFFFLALVTQGVLPFFEPSATTNHVTAVIRNDIGQLKWMETSATDYTPLESRGRHVYLREGCWYCHSQYVRPVTGETRRWGPVSEAGEYAYDVPHMFGTRRIGPDLTRVGLKYSDEWHLAHFWNPRMLTPESIMDPYSRSVRCAVGSGEDRQWRSSGKTLERNAVTERLFDFASKEQVKITPNAEGLLFVPMVAQGKYPVVFTPNNEYAGGSVKLAIETKEVEALIAYVQKLGMNRGKWRDLFEPQQIEAAGITLPRSEEWIDYGKEVYERRCVGCHGVHGDGNGPAATFLYKQRPRNFTQGVFKFRLTEGPLPSDGDMLRTITRGVRGTAMPPWYDLPLNDRLAVIQYIKYVLAVDRSDPERPVHILRQCDARAAAVYSRAAAAHDGHDHSRQGSLGSGQVLGMPWRHG